MVSGLFLSKVTYIYICQLDVVENPFKPSTLEADMWALGVQGQTGLYSESQAIKGYIVTLCLKVMIMIMVVFMMMILNDKTLRETFYVLSSLGSLVVL